MRAIVIGVAVVWIGCGTDPEPKDVAVATRPAPPEVAPQVALPKRSPRPPAPPLSRRAADVFARLGGPPAEARAITFLPPAAGEGLLPAAPTDGVRGGARLVHPFAFGWSSDGAEFGACWKDARACTTCLFRAPGAASERVSGCDWDVAEATLSERIAARGYGVAPIPQWAYGGRVEIRWRVLPDMLRMKALVSGEDPANEVTFAEYRREGAVEIFPEVFVLHPDQTYFGVLVHRGVADFELELIDARRLAGQAYERVADAERDKGDARGEAAARVAAARAEPDAWESLLRAAELEAMLGYGATVQVFVVEALRRGGEPVRERLADVAVLSPMRDRPWFAALQNTDAAALEAWVVDDSPPVHLVLADPDAATAPYSVKGVRVRSRATGKLFNNPTFEVAFDLQERAAMPKGSALLKAACRLGDEVIVGTGALDADDAKGGLRTEKASTAYPFSSDYSPERRHYRQCQLSFRAVPVSREQPVQGVGEFCFDAETVGEGPCTAWPATVAGAGGPEVIAASGKATAPPGGSGSRTSATIWVRMRVGAPLEVGQTFHAKFDCDPDDPHDEPPVAMVTGAQPWHVDAGQSFHAQAATQVSQVPSRCTVEIATRIDVARERPVATLCLQGSTVTHGAC